MSKESTDHDLDRPVGRRDALLGGASLAVLAAGSVAAAAKSGPAFDRTDVALDRADVSGAPSSTATTDAPTSSTSTSSKPPSGAPRSATAGEVTNLTEAERVLHVARRMSFGPTPALIAEIRAAGTSAWIDSQLNPSSIDDSAATTALSQSPMLSMSAAQIVAVEAGHQGVLHDSPPRPGEAIKQLRHAAVVRALLSKRQLNELLVDLWTNHFAVCVTAEEIKQEVVVHDRDVIRKYATGRFTDLLFAAAHSPALLRSLDQHVSTKWAPNENFARELMELHSLGVGHFTEADVKAAARLLTGWTIDSTSRQFVFSSSTHAGGPLSIAGWQTAGVGGQRDGEGFLRYLAIHPATATRVSTVLCRRFVADDPSPEIVAAGAAEYLVSGTSIAATLRAITRHPAFWSSYGLKARRGFDFCMAALRATPSKVDPNPDSDSSWIVAGLLSDLGHLLHAPTSPVGHPDRVDAWSGPGQLLNRWNAMYRLVTSSRQIDANAFTAELVGRPAQAALTALIERTVPGADAAVQAAAIVTHVGVGATDPFPNNNGLRLETAILILSLPEMQIR